MPVHHPIALATPRGQAAFDRGLALVYAFNFGEAERTFEQAVRLDPAAPMPYWGLALAEGPNLNSRQPSLAAERAASEALALARQRAAALPTTPEGAEERAYIAALALRLDCDPEAPFAKLEVGYGDAMRALAARYPNDPDAATLYAESLMEQRAWFAWVGDTAQGPSWNQVLTALEGVLHRWPNHLGANHLYIHASESANQPALALASAARLDALPRFFGDGHLLHMPAHVYLRTGRFIDAERASQAAAQSDRAYLRAHPDDTAYAIGYYLHNLSFLVYSAEVDGDFQEAYAAAKELAERARRYSAADPELQGDAPAPLTVLVRFARWNRILSLPAPAPSEPLGYQLYWHFARTCAAAGTGDSSLASREEHDFERMLKSAWVTQRPILVGVPYLPQTSLDPIMGALAGWRIAQSEGKQGNAVERLREAVAFQDKLAPADPPRWYPIREVLGAALLEADQPADAAAVFEQSLARVPGDPRAAYGLARALFAEGQLKQAAAEQAKFRVLWKGGAIKLQDF